MMGPKTLHRLSPSPHEHGSGSPHPLGRIGVGLDIALAALLALVFGFLVIWATYPDNLPPEWDEAVHLHDSIVFHNVLRAPQEISFDVVRAIANRSDMYPLLRPSGYYPPLVAGITSATYFWLPITPQGALLSNILFLVVLAVSVQQIGFHLFDRRVGWLACILVLACPIVFAESGLYMLDMPLTAVFALAIWILLWGRSFDHLARAALFGFVCGLGMLTKWTFVVFIFGPAAFVACEAVFRAGQGDRVRRIRHVCLAVVVGLATFGPYYLPILGELLSEAKRFSGWALAQGPSTTFSWSSAGYYGWLFWSEMGTPAIAILFLIGLVVLIREHDQHLALVAVSVLVPWALFTFAIANKQARYMMPLLIWVALIAAAACGGDWRVARARQRARLIMTSMLVMISLVQIGSHAWRIRSQSMAVAKLEWPIADIADALAEDLTNNPSGGTGVPPYVGVIPDHHYVNGQTLRYFTGQRRLPLNVIKLQRYDETSFDRFVDDFERYTYVLTKSAFATHSPVGQAALDAMDGFFGDHREFFEPLLTMTVEDGSEVALFARRDRSEGS